MIGIEHASVPAANTFGGALALPPLPPNPNSTLPPAGPDCVKASFHAGCIVASRLALDAVGAGVRFWFPAVGAGASGPADSVETFDGGGAACETG